MTIEQARQLIAHIKATSPSGVTFASMVTVTEPKMRKTDNPYFGKVQKVSRKVVGLGNSYENRVNNEQKKEGIHDENTPFVAQKPSGMHHVDGERMLLESDKTPGKYYLQVHATANNPVSNRYINTETGAEIDPEDLAPFMPERRENHAGGVEKDMIVYSVGIDNVAEIKVGDFKIG